MQRACTAQCFQVKFEKNKRRNKKMSIFLKALYFVNFCWMFGGMILVNIAQTTGRFQCRSITVDFGTQVWKEAWVNMPSEQYEKWVHQYPYFKDVVAPDQYEKWTLVFSYFNGVYTRTNERYGGRPIYREMRKVDNTPYDLVVPAEIKYCKTLGAWVFTHEHIRKTKKVDEVNIVTSPSIFIWWIATLLTLSSLCTHIFIFIKSGCNWLLRSQDTDEVCLITCLVACVIMISICNKSHTHILYCVNHCEVWYQECGQQLENLGRGGGRNLGILFLQWM